MYMMVFIFHCWFLFYIFFQKKNQTDKKIENGEGGMSSRALGFFRDKCHPCHCGHHQNQFHRDSSSFKFTFEKLFLKNKNNLIRTIINHIPVSDHFVSFLSKVLLSQAKWQNFSLSTLKLHNFFMSVTTCINACVTQYFFLTLFLWTANFYGGKELQLIHHLWWVSKLNATWVHAREPSLITTQLS